MMRKENGFTVIGTLILLFWLVVIVTLITRVLPAYVDNYQIRNSIKALRDLDASFFTDDPMSNVSVMKSKLLAQLDINDVQVLKNDQIKIVPTGEGKYLVKVKYTAIKPLIYNVSLMFDFDEAEEISVNTK